MPTPKRFVQNHNLRIVRQGDNQLNLLLIRIQTALLTQIADLYYFIVNRHAVKEHISRASRKHIHQNAECSRFPRAIAPQQTGRFSARSAKGYIPQHFFFR